MSGIITGVILIASISFLPWLMYLPKAVLSSIILIVVYVREYERVHARRINAHVQSWWKRLTISFISGRCGLGQTLRL